MAEISTKQELIGSISSSGKIVGSMLNMRGEKGEPGTPGKDGKDGVNPTITVGKTTVGDTANVVNSGTSRDAVLDFVLPKSKLTESKEGTTIKTDSNPNTTYQPINFTLDGRSTQKTRSGKNLLGIIDGTYTQNGITIVAEKGTLTLNGTATKTAFVSIPMSNTLNFNTGEKFTVSANNPVENGNLRIRFDQSGNYDTWLNGVNKVGTFTKNTDRELYQSTTQIRVESGTTLENYIIKPQLEAGSTATEYEPYGVSPSPDYPSEIESVGYENLFNKDNFTYEENYYNDDGIEQISSSTGKTLMKIPVEGNSEYVINGYSLMTYQKQGTVSRIYFFDENKQFISRTSLIANFSSYGFTTPSNCKYIEIQITLKTDELAGTKSFLEDIDTFKLEKGSIAHSYIPYGKSGIEVKTVGKNLFDKDNAPIINGFTQSSTGKIVSNNSTKLSYIECKPNTTYTAQKISGYIFNLSYSVDLPAIGVNFYGRKTNSTGTINTITTGSDAKYLIIEFYNNDTSVQPLLDSIQVEESSVATEYEPHKKATSLFLLNAPLRSLPNGVKDIAYIKNNKLYVERKVGSVVLDGVTNKFTTKSGTTNNVIWVTDTTYDVVNYGGVISSHFESHENVYNKDVVGIYLESKRIRCGFGLNTELTTLELANGWLANNNVKVDYELATPVTEEYGYSDFKFIEGENNISNTFDTYMTIEYYTEMKGDKGVGSSEEETVKKIWSNPNPDVAFSDTTITLSEDLSNFKFYMVIYKFYYTHTHYLSTGMLPSGFNALLQSDEYLSSQKFARRILTVSAGKTIDVTAVAGNVSSSEFIIPVEIYGIK